MKKLLVTLVLAALIATSIVSGSLALYSTTIDDLANENNQVVAKQFVYTGEGMEQFNEAVKIAPTETVEKTFAVRNYEETIISEVPMDIYLKISVIDAVGKSAIENLTAEIYDAEGTRLSKNFLTNGVGHYETNLYFSATKSEQYFTIKFYWESKDNDIDFQGFDFGNRIAITTTATQCIHDKGVHIDSGISSIHKSSAAEEYEKIVDHIENNPLVAAGILKQNEELQREIFEVNGNSFVILKDNELALLRGKAGTGYVVWKPIIAGDGTIMLTAQSQNTIIHSQAKGCSLLYANGKYYLYFSEKYNGGQIGSIWVSDQNFDTATLTNGVKDSAGYHWTEVTP